MQGGRGNRDPFFGGLDDAFGGFGGSGGFGGHGNLFSSVFGSRDPFDDPFFRQPFGGMLGPSMFGPSMFGSSMFGSSMFASAGSPFSQMPASGFLEHQAARPTQSRGPVIEEINSDDEKVDEGQKMDNPRKHRRSSNEPYVEDPDDQTEERKSKQLLYSDAYNMAGGSRSQPQARTFTYQSSSVTYGGANGAYYTSSTSRRTGSDGLTLEESKEADSTTRQATHRVSRGLHDKGHSLTRKLKSDGKVESMQTLHNLNEDEITGFEDAWKSKAKKNLPGWSDRYNALGSAGQENVPNAQAGRGGLALPSIERPQVQPEHNMNFTARERAGYLQQADRTSADRGHRKASSGRH